jgi:hypothetical protein
MYYILIQIIVNLLAKLQILCTILEEIHIGMNRCYVLSIF